MEGSVAATAAQGANGADGTQGGEGGGEATVDLNALAGQMGDLSEGQNQLRELVNGLATQLAPGGEQEGTDEGGENEGDDQIDLSFLEDPTLDSQEVAGHLQGLIDARAQQIAAQATGPLNDRLNTFERRAELAALVHEVPEMADEAISEQVVKATAAMADAYGWPDHLKSDPKMYRIVYMAAKATELANAEGNGDDTTVATLEGGGSARAAALAQQAQDMGDQIVGARKGRSALPFG